MRESIVRDHHFVPVSEARVDSKNRVSVPKKAKRARLYKVFTNDAGQILLDPQVLIPASEAWLFESKEALASIRRGLADLAERRVVRRRSLAKHAKDELE